MPSQPPPYPFADLSLARRLERTEANANVRSIEARARLWPETGAAWIAVGGARAMFDGPASPLTQTFGLGLVDEIRPADLDSIETFFAERGAPALHEVSPLAEAGLFSLLAERGYRPFEFTSVMFRPVDVGQGSSLAVDVGQSSSFASPANLVRATPVTGDAKILARVARPDEEDRWAQTAAAGWSEFAEVADFMRDIGRLSMATRDATCFIAELNGEAIATGALSIQDGVALFAGASTIPGRRGLGAQRALLDARLRFAADQRCDLAMMCAAPGSASQRNAERHSFRIAYTRMKFKR